jgi:ribose 5-phosphate isomerase RpiB
MTMRVAVASDHAGFSLKGKVAEYLSGLGHTVEEAKCGRESLQRPASAD